MNDILPSPAYLDGLNPEVREEMLDHAAKLLARRATLFEVGRALTKQFEVPAEERPAVIAAGLARLVDWLGVPRCDPRFDSLALCESVVRSNASVRERMQAQARIDELLGREPSGEPAPRPGQPTVNVTVNVADLPDDDLDRRIAALESRARAAGAAEREEAAPVILPHVRPTIPIGLRAVQDAPGEDQPGPQRVGP